MTREERREQQRILAALARDAGMLAARFELRPRSIEAERANVRRRYGVCYSDGTIRIRLRHASTGRLLKYSSLVDTLCHELAHLRHFDHGARFKVLYQRILSFARGRGIYRPGPPAVGRAKQRLGVGGVRSARSTESRQLELFAELPGRQDRGSLFVRPGGLSPRLPPSRRSPRASSDLREPRP